MTSRANKHSGHELKDGAHPLEVKALAYELFSRGFGYRTCARELGVSIYTARDWNRHYKNGTFEPSSGYRRRRRFFTDDYKRDVVKLFLQGNLSINQVAQQHSVTRRSVVQWIRDYRDELETEKTE